MAGKKSGFSRAMGNIYEYFKKKDEEEVNKKPLLGYRGRQIFVLTAFLAFSVFVGYNLLKFTVLEGEMWRNLANSQQQAQLTIKANRGTIYDANGTVLAQSSTVWDVVIAPQAIFKANEKRQKEYYEKKPEERGGAYKELSDIICNGLADLLEISPDKMLEECKTRERNYIIAKRKVEKPVVSEIRQFLLDNGIGGDCVYTEESSKR